MSKEFSLPKVLILALVIGLVLLGIGLVFTDVEWPDFGFMDLAVKMGHFVDSRLPFI